MRRELLLGCGHSRVKRIIPPNAPTDWVDLLTIDFDPATDAHVVIDLNPSNWDLPYIDEFDEIHAYEVLEHLGRQGNFIRFFSHFYEIWRMLKPDGYLCATVPSRFSPWLWGDPGHSRAILPETLIFLDQTAYAQCGKTALSDYRFCYKADFKIISSTDDRIFHSFILQAVKPARIIK